MPNCQSRDSAWRLPEIWGAVQSHLAWRLARLDFIAYSLVDLVLSVSTSEQLLQIVWFLGMQRRRAELDWAHATGHSEVAWRSMGLTQMRLGVAALGEEEFRRLQR